MKKIHVMLLLSLLMITSGCASLYITNKQLMDIENGMSRQEVKNILGKPDYRRFDGDTEEWEYSRYMAMMGYATVLVRFFGEEVVGMDTFENVTSPAATTTTVITTTK